MAGRSVRNERGSRAGAEPPAGPRVTPLAVGPERLVVLSFPVGAAPNLPALTPAERQILAAILRGMSNDEIARERGRSVRTVANQIAALFRKTGVRSRAELARRLFGRS